LYKLKDWLVLLAQPDQLVPRVLLVQRVPPAQRVPPVKKDQLA
jgi:hypothetical protein